MPECLDFNTYFLLGVADEAVKKYLDLSHVIFTEDARIVSEQLRWIDEFKLTVSLDQKGPYKLNFSAPHFNMIHSLEFDEQSQLVHIVIAKSLLGHIPTIRGFKGIAFVCNLAAELCAKPTFPSNEQISKVKRAIERDKHVSLGTILQIFYGDNWTIALKRLATFLAFEYFSKKHANAR